ncbi:MAG: sigma 54-interacting transcriptional regulator [Gemmataceae bacterium]|nr:sigma 54-interacting transcriptional regulator [Gemmataceae bacterium]
MLAKIGDQEIKTWANVLQAPEKIRDSTNKSADWFRVERNGERDEELVRIWYQGDPPGWDRWAILGNIPVEEQIPSLLWFLLKVSLFAVGVLVFWQRPHDPAAAQFYVLCVVTLGAFMGGYHWTHIATTPWLVAPFMVCAVLLPAASLHFYLVFPRKKGLYERRPWTTLGIMYGVPLGFLALMFTQYVRLRWQVQGDAATEASYLPLLWTINTYFGIAATWYLASVIALSHSFRTIADPTEKNQVKWIFCGAVLALVPIGYSFYLAMWDPDTFGAGGATWPMFAASFCFTIAFAVSITRYRLMQLDQIVSSGFGYVLADPVYYAVVFIGTFMISQVIAGPSFTEALTVSSTALLLMVVLDVARGRIKRALDRRFSRDKSQLDRTLQRLSQAVEQLVDPPALARKLLHAISELLGVARGAVYLRQGEPPLYHLAGTLGPAPPLEDLSPGFPLVAALQANKPVLAAPYGFPNSAAQRQLEFLGGEIAHPLLLEDRLLAILVLGRKDQPYRPEDIELLAALAQITVVALESAAGHRTIEQLNHDLQGKVQKIAEQQRRILSLQSQLRRQVVVPAEPAEPAAAASAAVEPALPAPAGIVGASHEVRQLLSLVRKVAATDAVVLLRGESGTGKELLARAVHETSARAAKPYVKVHCAALSPSLLESELFGHVKGAFTGAHRDKVGRFELANGGTLFLDEIGDITLDVQTKLLRVLQEKTIERVGSAEPLHVDVRIIAATHQDLDKLIRQGRFREDLFYRLNVFPIRVPPLRERPEDIPELAMHFMRQSAQRCKKGVTQLDDDVLVLLKSYRWPGNIRQLENVLERAVVITEGDTISLGELPSELLDESETALPETVNGNGSAAEPVFSGVRPYASLRGERERAEREQLVHALAAADGNKAEAARVLGIARSTLISRLKKFGLS